MLFDFWWSKTLGFKGTTYSSRGLRATLLKSNDLYTYYMLFTILDLELRGVPYKNSIINLTGTLESILYDIFWNNKIDLSFYPYYQWNK